MKTAIALGTFDGLHAGHRAVLKETQNFHSIAVTFKIPPKAVLSKNCRLLILPQDRKERLKQLGINQVVMQDFDTVKNISANEYLINLKNNYNPSRIVCGFNYRFGKDALGNTDILADFCKQNGIELIVVPQVCDGDDAISATAIRKWVMDGQMQRASGAIYGGFKFTAPVLHGDARGRKIGFPTANQAYPEMLIKPCLGVYTSRVTIDGKQYDAITNIGYRPTFETEKIGCETYIKDFSGDIYGKEMTIKLIKFIRPEQKFSSVDGLKTAIASDVKMLD